MPRDRTLEQEGVLWLLGKLMNEQDEGEITLTANDHWIVVERPASELDRRSWAIWRNTGAVFLTNPGGDVPDEPVWRP